MLQTESFFDLTDFPHSQLFSNGKYVWTGLNNLKEYMDGYPFPSLDTALLKDNEPLKQTLILHDGDIKKAEEFDIVFGDTTKGKLEVFFNGERLSGASVLMAGSFFAGKKIVIGKGTLVESGAMIKSPAIIGDCNEVRQGAYLRGCTLSGKGCVLGHTTEIKHSIFLNDVKAGHFNYIGDSILGNNTNLGAGTKFANLRFIDGNIFIEHEEKFIDTGMRKFGAILGDNTQTGCNSVTNPGTILGKGSFVMPNTTVRPGYHPSGTIIRMRGN
jgi:bifunctional N-acetylglucosamine-1-phosphate-uridyltransferase/glucosamine-1-phosphate-acetyltransferase GlmU-like protein